MAFRYCLIILLSGWLLAPFRADAEDAPIYHEVVQVISGHSLTLDNGMTVRLRGIHAPIPGKQDRGDRSQPDEPLARDAIVALRQLTRDTRVRLEPPTPDTDRYGRLLAHAYTDSGVWLQEALVRDGLALVFPLDEQWEGLVPLLKAEASARATRHGIWAEDYFRVLTTDEAEDYLNRVRLVRGTVLAVKTVRKRTYVNFGPDWRTDYTLSIPANRLEAVTLGLKLSDITDLEGKTLLMRGLLFYTNGASMEAIAAQQIEILE